MKRFKKIIAVLLSAAFWNIQAALLFPHPIHAQQGTKPLVAVLDLQVTGGILKSEAQSLSDRLRGEMQGLKKFDIIERSQMDALLKEQDFAMSDMTEANAAKAGKLLSVEQIVVGSIGRVGRSYTVDVRLIDVVSGRVITASQQDYNGPTEGLTQVIRNVARQFAGLPPLKVSVANNTKWWVMGSLLAVGGGVAAYMMLNKKESGSSGPPAFSDPPALP